MPKNNISTCLALINHAENPKNLDGTHSAGGNLAQADFAHVKGVVVATNSYVVVNKIRVLPSAREAAVVEINISLFEGTQFALLLVLLDGIEGLLGGNFELCSCT
jgi:hypothetical protein